MSRERTQPEMSSFLPCDEKNRPEGVPVHLAIRNAMRAHPQRPRARSRIRLAAMGALGATLGLGGTVIAVGIGQASDRVDMYETMRGDAQQRARAPAPQAAYTAQLVSSFAPASRPVVQQPLGALNARGQLVIPAFQFNPFHQPGQEPRRAATGRKSETAKARTAALFDGGMSPDTVAGASDQARTICVRLCDGFQHPIAPLRDPSDLRGHESLCRAMFPGVPTRVFRVAAGAVTIDDAVGPDGRTYRSLPMAYAYKTSIDPACARPRTGQGTISVYRDFTLRPGDSVFVNGKVRVFTGASSFPFTRANFRDFRSTDALTAQTRRDIDQRVGVSQRERLEREVRAMSRLREANASPRNTAVDIVRGGPLQDRQAPVRVIDIHRR
jgi:hypothetical protein